MAKHVSAGDSTDTTARHVQSEVEHKSLVVDYNRSAAPYPADTSIIGLFADQVARTPDAEAIRFGDRSLTYRELDGRANQMAACLGSLGVSAGQVVVLAMEHSIEVVCAILGVLKTGAAYAPMDPSIPKKRLASIVKEIANDMGGALPVLVTQARLLGHVPNGVARVVTLDADFASIDACPASTPVTTVSPDNLAYIIFTSGSTGTPKGVMIRHRSLVNYIWWASAQYAQGEQLTWPLFSSLAFDLTVTSIFTPLISGGRIVVYAEEAGGHGLVILKVIQGGVADIVKLTPAHLAMVKDLNLGATRIRRLIVGGEDFKTELAREITDRFGRPVEIYNEYGPTEATVGCMIHRYDRYADRAPSVPIGRPAANARLYVLDEHLEPVPTGVIGEMYLAGDGLALGYFNRRDLTSKVFLLAADPRQKAPGVTAGTTPEVERLYKTGDLARWTNEGRMEFLGRADHQVKIGGFRIELGEIEACLLKHADIRQAVVAVNRRAAAESPQETRTDVDRLVAYYVGDQVLPPSELRAHLATQLPEYMLPSYFIRLDALPLTPNGKVDRKALPAPGANDAEPTSGAVAPRTKTETLVLDIFRGVLGRANLGVLDNFFELGGDSFMAMRLVSRLQAASGATVPLGSLFEQPTVAGLAEVVDRLSWVAQSHARPFDGASREEIEL
jgi:amino acid adenylation domain-containing protein